MIGGLGLGSPWIPSRFGQAGSYLVFLSLTLVPLSVFPQVERAGLGPLPARVAAPGLVLVATLGGVVYLSTVHAASVLSCGFPGVAATGLAAARVSGGRPE